MMFVVVLYVLHLPLYVLYISSKILSLHRDNARSSDTFISHHFGRDDAEEIWFVFLPETFEEKNIVQERDLNPRPPAF